MRFLAACVLALAPGLLTPPEMGEIALPAALPALQVRQHWERAQGEGRTSDFAVSYDLWVNPRRPALYEITHFSFDVRGADGAWTYGGERVLWNPPGERTTPAVPLQDWARVGNAWEVVPHGTDAYRLDMMRALAVYDVKRRGSRVSPAP